MPNLNPQFRLLIQAVIRYLSFRDRSWYEIDQYLIKQNADPELTQEVKNYLESHDLVNDQRFGFKWAEYRLSHHKGDRQIAYDLKQKGLSDSLCHLIVAAIESELWNQAMEALMIKSQAKLKNLNQFQRKAKLYQIFNQHGFSSKLIDAFLRRRVE